MNPRKDAALRILEWELEGHGNEVLQAMLSHPDMSLSDAVDMIEKENPAWTDGERAGSPERKGEPEEHPEPEARRGRSTPEVLALQQEFATFRHLLRPAEAREVEAALRAIEARPSPDDLAAIRRRLRTLALQAAFWRELAIPTKLPNALGVMLLRVEGGGLVAQGGSTDYFGDERIAQAVRGEVGRQGKGVYVMHLPVGRLVIARGRTIALATLFRHAPGKEVVSVLERTVGAVEENPKAAERTFGNPGLAARYAEALLKLVQRVAG